jgi:hypothetical protein
VETSWRDAGTVPKVEDAIPGDPAWSKRTHYKDCRKIVLAASLENTWKAVTQLGGKTGWYYADWLWSLRGLLDRLIGGVGLQRGRRLGQVLRPGDALDFWRVAVAEKEKRLVLAAEMKLPGEAFLEFNLKEISGNQIEVRQLARFLPRGLTGVLYWHAVFPLHNLVFDGMLRGIANASGGEIVEGPQRIKLDRA